MSPRRRVENLERVSLPSDTLHQMQLVSMMYGDEAAVRRYSAQYFKTLRKELGEAGYLDRMLERAEVKRRYRKHLEEMRELIAA